MTKVRRRTSRAAAWVVAGLVATCAALYLLASWEPSGYTPPSLTQEEKVIEANRFLSSIMGFTNEAEKSEAFFWELSEVEVNRYLAAADEIAFCRLNRSDHKYQRGDVQRMMDAAGLAQPAVSFVGGGEKDLLTMMVRTDEYGKVLSADLRLAFTDEGNLRVILASTRVGLLPVPRFAVRGRLERFKKILQERLGKLKELPEESRGGGVFLSGFTSADLAALFAEIIAAIDETPFTPKIRARKHYVRIRNITIDNGTMMLDIVPIRDKEEEKDTPDLDRPPEAELPVIL